MLPIVVRHKPRARLVDAPDICAHVVVRDIVDTPLLTDPHEQALDSDSVSLAFPNDTRRYPSLCNSTAEMPGHKQSSSLSI